MTTPQQQAAKSARADIRLQLETIRLAKQTTLKAIAKQKADTRQAYQLTKQLLAQQIATTQQSMTNTKTKIQQREKVAQKTNGDVQTEPQMTTPDSHLDEQIATEVVPTSVQATKSDNAATAQDIGQTLMRFQIEATQTIQVLQLELDQSIQQLGTQLNLE